MKLFAPNPPLGILPKFLATLAMAAVLIPGRSIADTYLINRTFSQGGYTALLTGTLDIPQGSYTIMNMGVSPFTAVNLTLTMNGTPYTLTHSLTGLINGTGQFSIDAGSTTLSFNTANANGANPADLVFSDTLGPSDDDRYVIGYNGAPGFQAAYTHTGGFPVPLAFPVVFGVAVPEPGALTLLLLALGFCGVQRRRR